MDKEKFVKWLKEQIKRNEKLRNQYTFDCGPYRQFDDLASAYAFTLNYVEEGEFDPQPEPIIVTALKQRQAIKLNDRVRFKGDWSAAVGTVINITVERYSVRWDAFAFGSAYIIEGYRQNQLVKVSA